MKIKVNKNYCAPVVELIDIPVEQGFAASSNIGELDWNDEIEL